MVVRSAALLGHASQRHKVRIITHGDGGEFDSLVRHLAGQGHELVGAAGLAVGEEHDMSDLRGGLGESIARKPQRRRCVGSPAREDAPDESGALTGLGVRSEGDQFLRLAVERDDPDEVACIEGAHGERGGVVGDLLLRLVRTQHAPPHASRVVENEDDGGLGGDEPFGQVEPNGHDGFEHAALPTAGAEGVRAADEEQPAAQILHVGGEGSLRGLRHDLRGDILQDHQVVLLQTEHIAGQTIGRDSQDGESAGRERLGDRAAGIIVLAADAVGEQDCSSAGGEREGLAAVVLGDRVAGESRDITRFGVRLEDSAETMDPSVIEPHLHLLDGAPRAKFDPAARTGSIAVEIHLDVVGCKAQRARGITRGREQDPHRYDRTGRGGWGGIDALQYDLAVERIQEGQDIDRRAASRTGRGDRVTGGLMTIAEKEQPAGGIGRDERATEADRIGDVGPG